MNIQHLRHSLKVKWLLYYQQNRPWLIQLQIWGTFDGQRRPSSSFILATVSNLEPQLTQMFPLIVALNNNPDQIVAALGLNFNPDQELQSLTEAPTVAKTNDNSNGLTAVPPEVETNGKGNGLSMQILPKAAGEVNRSPATKPSNLPSLVDESCYGKSSPNAGVMLSILAVIGSLAVVVVKFSG